MCESGTNDRKFPEMRGKMNSYGNREPSEKVNNYNYGEGIVK